MFLKAKEAAKVLQMGVQQVYSLLWMGEIEAIKFGRHWRLVPESVNEYVKRHPRRKDRDPSGYFIYTGNSGYLFCCASDCLSPDLFAKITRMEGRRRQLVHRACRPAKVLQPELKSIKQLELFSA